MLRDFFITFILTILLISCSSGSVVRKDIAYKAEANIKTISASFKTCQKIGLNTFQLIFRRMDNCRYILFQLTAEELNRMNFKFLLQSNPGTKVNSKLVDRPFYISYRPVPNKDMNRIVSIDTPASGKYSSL